MMLHRALDRTALLPPFAWRTWPGRAITASVAAGRAAACGAPASTISAARSAVATARSLGIAAHSPVDRLAEKNSPV